MDRADRRRPDRRYLNGLAAHSTWSPSALLTLRSGGGSAGPLAAAQLTGQVLRVEPPRRLSYLLRCGPHGPPTWSDSGSTCRPAVTWRSERTGEMISREIEGVFGCRVGGCQSFQQPSHDRDGSNEYSGKSGDHRNSFGGTLRRPHIAGNRQAQDDEAKHPHPRPDSSPSIRHGAPCPSAPAEPAPIWTPPAHAINAEMLTQILHVGSYPQRGY